MNLLNLLISGSSRFWLPRPLYWADFSFSTLLSSYTDSCVCVQQLFPDHDQSDKI